MKKIEEKYTYFQPGEMLFLLTHKDDQLINDKINNEEDNPLAFDKIIEGWIRNVSKLTKLPEGVTLATRMDLVCHFEGMSAKQSPSIKSMEDPSGRKEPRTIEQHGTFSLVPVELRSKDGDRVVDDKLMDFFIEFQKQIELEKQEAARNNKPEQKILVENVLLNWLVGPASEYGGGGGPGSRPEPYKGTPEDAPYHFIIPSARSFMQEGVCQCGSGVTVAILDTAPSLHDMAATYEQYHKLNPRNRTKSHKLIELLFKPDSRFHVHPASLEDLLRMRAVHLRDHNYDMSAHGLFIAGIIHDIAPEAEIHLYEVLNPEGVGDLLSIARGLQKVLKSFEGGPLVVNCSFMLNIPLYGQPIIDLDPRLQNFIFGDTNGSSERSYVTKEMYECGKVWLADQGKAIEWICNQLLQQGSRVIAAAGNDWRPTANQERPQARFPAAFDSVLGVGALPKNMPVNAAGQYLPASYSNLSDAPEEVGVTTLGGEAGQKNGVLGVYLGKFPLTSIKAILRKSVARWRLLCNLIDAIPWDILWHPQNKNNWAWWSGTSFATPIIAGLTACALSDLGAPASTQAAIKELYGEQVIQQSLTINSEDGVVDVQQVPS